MSHCFIRALILIYKVVHRDPFDERPRSSSSAQRFLLLSGAAAKTRTQSAASTMTWTRIYLLQRSLHCVYCFITALNLISKVVYRDPVDERPRSSGSAQRSSNDQDPERSPYSDMGQGPSSAEDPEEPLTSEEVTPRLNPYSSIKKERSHEPGLMNKVHVTQNSKPQPRRYQSSFSPC